MLLLSPALRLLGVVGTDEVIKLFNNMGSISTFKEKLDKEHQWPDQYMFKFVIPVAKSQELTDLFEGETLEKKHSKAGNYVSITMKKLMNSSDDVIAVYQQANKIEGLIML